MWILYAEDDIEDFNFFCEIITSIDPTVTFVNTRNGAETIDFLEGADSLPDVVFLDINMPAMDGKSCLREIRKNPRLKELTVFVYTTSRDPKDKEQCIQLGASDYLEKPSSFHDALALFTKVLSKIPQSS
jgi:CheY-like chemotaxis protein